MIAPASVALEQSPITTPAPVRAISPAEPATSVCNDRNACRHRLDHGRAPDVLAGRKNEDVRLRVVGLRVVCRSCEMNPPGHSSPLGGCSVRTGFAVPDHDEVGVLAHRSHRLDRRSESLSLEVVTDEEQDLLVFSRPKRARVLVLPFELRCGSSIGGGKTSIRLEGTP